MRFFGVLVALLSLASKQGYAVEQGEPGEDSTAITTISISILPNILITNVRDIFIDVADRTSDVSFTQDFCVTGNTGTNYFLQASGSAGDGSPFELLNTEGERLPYEFFFNGDLNQNIDVPLDSGVDSAPYELQNLSLSCDGAPNAQFTILLRSEDLLLAPAGLFSGSLSLTVAAE